MYCVWTSRWLLFEKPSSPLRSTPRLCPEISDSALRQMTLVGGQIPHWGGQCFSEDLLPEKMTTKQRNYVSKRYRILVDEFYTKSKREVVTPGNVDSFLKVHQRWSALTGKPLHWDLAEQWSCSGRLSYHALKRGLSVGFPVDYRYGWDL